MEDFVVAKTVSLANYSDMAKPANVHVYLIGEQTVEGAFLMLAGILGISLNLIVLCLALICGPLRKWLSGFAMHGCLLEMMKSGLCIPFALTLLHSTMPPYCAILGTVYIIIQTASMFNLLAMVLAEAYVFHVHNLNEKEAGGLGAMMCFLFGILMIYVGSLIVHLGPTFIGGELKFNKDIGNCLYAYGEIKNYIVQVMWIGITTITYLVVLRYFIKFFVQLRANGKFRITALARNAAAIGKGESVNKSIYDVVYRLKRRVKVLFAMLIINVVCWYPLFLLTLIDYKYEKPRYLYRILTVIAWSHCALIPIPLLAFDKSFGLWFQAKDIVKKFTKDTPGSETRTPLMTYMKSNLADSSENTKTMNSVGNHMSTRTPFKIQPHSSPLLQKADPVPSAPPLLSHESCRNSPCSVRSNKTNASVYDRVNAELQEVGTKIPSPNCDCDTLESRINQSRETDLLYDFKIDHDDSIGDIV